jgi:hypothetical protein
VNNAIVLEVLVEANGNGGSALYYGTDFNFGDYFVLSNYKSTKEIFENYDNFEKSLVQRQLPPANGGSSV